MAQVAVLGLGALAAAYLSKVLDDRPAADVVVVAHGERAERLRRDGMVVNSRRYNLRLAEPGEVAEVVIVAVKGYQLDQAIADLAGVVGPDTAIVSLLNGVSSEVALRAQYPGNFIPLALSIGSNCGREGTGFRFYTTGLIQLGEPRVEGQPYPSDRVNQLAALLTAAGWPVELPDDMEHALWFKYVLNCGVNQASALAAAPYRPYQVAGSQARALMVALIREAMAVAAADGVTISEADLTEILAIIDSLDPAGFTSMATDARRHQQMEIDLFAGEVVRRGEAAGLEVPVSQTVAQILRTQQESWI